MNVRNNTSYKEASDVNSRNFVVALPARNWQRIPPNHGLHVLILRVSGVEANKTPGYIDLIVTWKSSGMAFCDPAMTGMNTQWFWAPNILRKVHHPKLPLLVRSFRRNSITSPNKALF